LEQPTAADTMLRHYVGEIEQDNPHGSPKETNVLCHLLKQTHPFASPEAMMQAIQMRALKRKVPMFQKITVSPHIHPDWHHYRVA
jgi:hypothetical protein